MKILTIGLLLAMLACAIATNFQNNATYNSDLQDLGNTDVGGWGRCLLNRYTRTVGCCFRHNYIYLLLFKIKLLACLRLRALRYSKRAFLTYDLNRKRVFNQIISMRQRRFIVCRKVPGLPKYVTNSLICLVVNNINYRKKIVCARVYGYMQVTWKRFRVNNGFTCFQLPKRAARDSEMVQNTQPSTLDSAVDLQNIPTFNIDGNDLETEELDLGNDEFDIGADEYDLENGDLAGDYGLAEGDPEFEADDSDPNEYSSDVDEGIFY